MHMHVYFHSLLIIPLVLGSAGHLSRRLHGHSRRADASSSLLGSLVDGVKSTVENAVPQDQKSALDDLLSHSSSSLPTNISGDHDSSNSPVDVSGEHAFQAPGPTDQRGPCPALNALANHGYIPRNGIVTLLGAVSAITKVYNMGVDLALVLAVMGVVWSGNPLSLSPSFSIGGEDKRVENALDNLLGLLNTPQGIDRTHNAIEADSSPTRDDLYLYNNAWTMNLATFREWHDMADASGIISFDTTVDFAAKRFNDSVATNPYFYYGPFTGLIARNAGFLFASRILANHSDGGSTTVMNQETLKSFWAVTTGANGDLVYSEGHERIPDDWVSRSTGYGIVELNLDVLGMVLRYPQLGSIGGNTGTVNSFAPIDLGNVAGGVVNTAKLLEGNNLVCFAFSILKTASPNYLGNLYSILKAPLDLILPILDKALLSLACPSFDDLTYGGQPFLEALQQKYPGSKSTGRAL